MVTKVIHPFPDQILVETVVELGCLPPAFTRAPHPGCFQQWEDRANELLRFASFLPAGKTTDRLEGLKRACDSYTGQPLPAPTPRKAQMPMRQFAQLVDLALIGMILFAALVATLALLPPSRVVGSSLDEASLFGPKIGIRAGALRFGPAPTHAADARP